MVEQATALASYAAAATELLTLFLAAAAGSALITSACGLIHYAIGELK